MLYFLLFVQSDVGKEKKRGKAKKRKQKAVSGEDDREKLIQDSDADQSSEEMQLAAKAGAAKLQAGSKSRGTTADTGGQEMCTKGLFLAHVESSKNRLSIRNMHVQR